jgi:hypothetical protein
MPDTPLDRTAQTDLAFLRSIVEGRGRPPITLAICYLAGGVLYGLQCLFHIGQMLGWVKWPGLASLVFVIAITGSFLVILVWAIRRDKREEATLGRGPLVSRAMSAGLSGAGMANAAMMVIFAVGAIRDHDFAQWLYYPAVAFGLQSAAWYAAWNLRRKRWMLLTCIGHWLTAAALGLTVREPAFYLGICTFALFGLFGYPGWIMYREARAPQPEER